MNRFFEKELNKLARMIDEIDVYKKASMDECQLASMKLEKYGDSAELTLEVKAKLPSEEFTSADDLCGKIKSLNDSLKNKLEELETDLSDDGKFECSSSVGNVKLAMDQDCPCVMFSCEVSMKKDGEESFPESFKEAVEKVFPKSADFKEHKTASIYSVGNLYRKKYASKMFSANVAYDPRPKYIGDALFASLMTLYKKTEELFTAVENSNDAVKSPDVKIPVTLDKASAMGLLGMAMRDLVTDAAYEPEGHSTVKSLLRTIRNNFNKVYYMAKEFNDPMAMGPENMAEGLKAWGMLSGPLDSYNKFLTESEKALSTFKPKPKYKAPAPATTSRPAAPAKSAPSAELETKESYLSYLQQGNSPEQIATSVGTMGEVAAFKEALEEHYSESSLTDEEKENIKSVYFSLES